MPVTNNRQNILDLALLDEGTAPLTRTLGLTLGGRIFQTTTHARELGDEPRAYEDDDLASIETGARHTGRVEAARSRSICTLSVSAGRPRAALDRGCWRGGPRDQCVRRSRE